MQPLSDDDRVLAITDAYRSMVMALAIVHGDNPADAVRKHEEWCEMMKSSISTATVQSLNPVAEEWRALERAR